MLGLVIAFNKRSVIVSPVLIEFVNDAGNDDIHLLEYLVGEIERAIGQECQPQCRRRCAIPFILCSPRDPLDVTRAPVVVQAIGEGEILRMIRNRHVLIAARRERPRPFLQWCCAPSVSTVCMCTSPRMSESSSRRGSSWFEAASISPRFSRNSGGMKSSLSLA